MLPQPKYRIAVVTVRLDDSKPVRWNRTMSDVVLQSGWRRTISLHIRQGESWVRLRISNGECSSYIRFYRREIQPVLEAMERARTARPRFFREEAGTIKPPGGWSLVVTARRFQGDPGISFQWLAADGAKRGKPKSLFGMEFEAFSAACLSLMKCEE